MISVYSSSVWRRVAISSVMAGYIDQCPARSDDVLWGEGCWESAMTILEDNRGEMLKKKSRLESIHQTALEPFPLSQDPLKSGRDLNS